MNFLSLEKVSYLRIEEQMDFMKKLTPEEVQELKNEIDTWKDSHYGIQSLKDMFNDCCEMNVPVHDLKEFAKKHIYIGFLISKTYTWGQGKFGYVLNFFLEDLGVSRWPLYGDTKEYSEQFYKDLEMKNKERGYYVP